MVTTFWFSLFGFVALAPVALIVGDLKMPHTWGDAVLLCGTGVVGYLGQWFMCRSLQLEEVRRWLRVVWSCVVVCVALCCVELCVVVCVALCCVGLCVVVCVAVCCMGLCVVWLCCVVLCCAVLCCTMAHCVHGMRLGLPNRPVLQR